MFNQIDLFKKDIEFVENMFRTQTDEKKVITETNHSQNTSGEGFATLLEDLNTISSNVNAISLQETVDHNQFLNELNDKVYGGALKIPSVKYLTSSRGNYLGRAIMKVERTVATGQVNTSMWIEIQKRVIPDDELHKSVLAHESIHIYQYQNMEPQDQVRYARGTLNFDGHGATFLPWMEKINALYGKDFVTVQGHYSEKTPSKSFYAVLAKAKRDGRISVGTFMKMTPKIRHHIERINDMVKKGVGYEGMKIIKTNDDTLLQASVVSQGMSIFTDQAEQDKLKKMYDEGESEFRFADNGTMIEDDEEKEPKVQKYDDEDSTFIYIEESNNEMDVKVIHGIIDSTVDKIYASAAKHKVTLAANKESLKDDIKAITGRGEVSDLSIFLNRFFHESKDSFRKELYTVLAELAETLRKYSERFPDLNCKEIIRKLATIQVKSDFEEQAPPMQANQSPQADIQKAEGKKLAMGRKANDWLRKLNQFSTNASKEVASGNIGTAASDFFEMIAEMPKQDWYKHFFKV